MNILFRVDSGNEIGLGHLIRCIALAQSMGGNNISFLCRDTVGNKNIFVESLGFRLFDYKDKAKLNESKDIGETKSIIETNYIDIVVVDHYSLSSLWEGSIKKIVKKLVVIDDFEDRNHNCDFLVDSARDMKSYSSNELFGKKFSLLRSEFKTLRSKSLTKRSNTKDIDRILISYGGTDIKGYTIKSISILKELNFKGEVGVMISSGVSFLSDLYDIPGLKLHIDCEDVANTLHNYDLVIGALGVSSWERCCLGLPSISIKVAGNQNSIERVMKDNKATIIIDDLDNNLKPTLQNILYEDSMLWWHEMVKNSSSVCDGMGATRVASAVINSI